MITPEFKDEGVRRFFAMAPGATRKAVWKSVREGLALIERHHKRQEMIRKAFGGARLSSGDARQQLAHPYKLTSRTGQLADSYTREIEKEGSDVVGHYGSALKIAQYHEEGRRGSWPIVARRAKALKFAGGAMITRTGRYKSTVWTFRKQVVHHGYPARPGVQRTLNYTTPMLEAISAEATFDELGLS